MTIQDWAMTYDELEPCYEQIIVSTSSAAGLRQGRPNLPPDPRRSPAGNVFEAARSNE